MTSRVITLVPGYIFDPFTEFEKVGHRMLLRQSQEFSLELFFWLQKLSLTRATSRVAVPSQEFSLPCAKFLCL